MHISQTRFRMLPAMAVLAVQVASAETTLLGTATIPGTATDRSGLSEQIGPGVPHNLLGSFGSAIAYTGQGNRYVAMNDRGPADGAFPYQDRFQTFEITVDPSANPAVKCSLAGTTMLKDSQGKSLTGAFAAIDPVDWAKSLRFDPEGVRVSRQGTLLVSEEYGPWIEEFSMDGKQIRRITPPAKFMNPKADADAAKELPPNSTAGRQPNRGFEGLAISPDGTKVFAILQSPLIQDGALDASNARQGINIRILEIRLEDSAMREYVYPLESPKNGVNEILAVNDHQLLVLERDGKPGVEAASRGIYLIDLRDATDVSGIPALPAKALPAGVHPVSKKLFLNLLDPKFKLSGEGMPEKIEGMAFGPDLPDGRHALIVTTDNDLKPTEASQFWVFGVDAADLPGYVPQVIDGKSMN